MKAGPLLSTWLIKSLSLFELPGGERKSWWCLTRKFAKSALGQSKDMLFILHKVPVAFSADSELIGNSVLLLSEPLDIQVVTRVLSLERARDKGLGVLCRRYGGRVGFVARFRSSHQPIWLPMGRSNQKVLKFQA